MHFTPEAFRAWPTKRITLLGMSGVGKTWLSSLLRRNDWFHYSADFRIGKRYLDLARKRLAVQLAHLARQLDNPGPWAEDNALVVSDFVADVQVMYALEFKEGAQLVSHGMMKAWGLDPERLHQRALANLDRAHGDLAVIHRGSAHAHDD